MQSLRENEQDFVSALNHDLHNFNDLILFQDYRGLLTPNLNLNEVVNSGKAFLFFDCPLIPFGQVGTDGLMKPPTKVRGRSEDEGKTFGIQPRSATEPREIKEFRRTVTDKYGIERDHYYLKEIYDDFKMEPFRKND